MWAGDEALLSLPDLYGSSLDCIRRRGIRNVKVLSIGAPPDVLPPMELRWLLQNLPDIRSLDLSSCQEELDDDAMRTSVGWQQYTSLMSLNLRTCSLITDASVDCITEHAPNLAELYIGYCGKITDSALGYASMSPRKLKLLDVSGCSISDSDLMRLAGFSETGELLDASAGNEIEILILATYVDVTDSGLRYVSENIAKLVFLDISECPLVSDAGLERISKIATLKFLNPKWCERLTHKSIRHLATGRSSLEQLEMRRCVLIDDQGVSCIDSGPGLLDLTTMYVERTAITDNALAKLARSLSHLTQLDISMCDLITNAGARVLAEHLPQLLWLRMEYCTRLSDGVMKHLARMDSLKVLSLQGCHKITDVGWRRAAGRRVSFGLEEVDVGCTSAGDIAVRYIAQCMPVLRYLDLSGCPISNRALSYVARHIPRLDELSLNNCLHLTDAGLHALARCHDNLRVISLAGCPSVTETGKQNLASKIPGLQIF